LPWKSTGDEDEHHLLAMGSSTEDFQVYGNVCVVAARAYDTPKVMHVRLSVFSTKCSADLASHFL
jgi:hypothetical protein